MTPIRVLTGNIEQKYLCINDDVQRLHIKLKGKVSPHICIDENLASFFGPKVLMPQNQIIVSESFLNYLWAFTYFAFAYQEKTNDLLCLDSKATHLPMDTPVLITALKLFDYSKQLVKDGSLPWPSGLISPLFNSPSTNETEEFSLKTSGIFSTAIACLFMHELGHVSLDHRHECQLKSNIEMQRELDRRYEPEQDEVSTIIAAETQADNFAIDLLLRTKDTEEIQINNSYGVVCCFLSMLFQTTTLRGLGQEFHSGLHDRVYRAVQKVDDLGIKEKGYFAHFAAQILMLVLDRESRQLHKYDAGTDELAFLREVLERLDDEI